MPSQQQHWTPVFVAKKTLAFIRFPIPYYSKTAQPAATGQASNPFPCCLLCFLCWRQECCGTFKRPPIPFLLVFGRQAKNFVNHRICPSYLPWLSKISPPIGIALWIPFREGFESPRLSSFPSGHSAFSPPFEWGVSPSIFNYKNSMINMRKSASLRQWKSEGAKKQRPLVAPVVNDCFSVALQTNGNNTRKEPKK